MRKNAWSAGAVLALVLLAASPAVAEESIATITGTLTGGPNPWGITYTAAIPTPALWGSSAGATLTAIAAWAGHHNHMGLAPLGVAPTSLLLGPGPESDTIVGVYPGGQYVTGTSGLGFPVVHYGPATVDGSAGGSPFRWVLHDNNNGAYWSSDPSENAPPEGYQHLMVFSTNVAGTYVLAWEDLSEGTSDNDYNDLVLVATGVTPVPEPGTMILLGSGALGLFAYARRRRLSGKKA